MRDCQHAGRAHIGGLCLHIGERVVVWWCLVGWMEMVVAWGVDDSVDVQTTSVGWALHLDVGGCGAVPRTVVHMRGHGIAFVALSG